MQAGSHIAKQLPKLEYHKPEQELMGGAGPQRDTSKCLLVLGKPCLWAWLCDSGAWGEHGRWQPLANHAVATHIPALLCTALL